MTERHGGYPELTDEEIDKWYEVKNSMTGGTQGVSFDDLMGWNNIANGIY